MHHAVVGKNVAMEESTMSPPSSIEFFYIIVAMEESTMPPPLLNRVFFK